MTWNIETVNQHHQDTKEELWQNILMKNIYILFCLFIFLYGCDMENPGGVLTYNQLPKSVITYIDNNKIIGDEEIVAYYDYTITLNNSESVILTDKNIIHYKSGRTEKISLDTIKSISEVEYCYGLCILITSLNNKNMLIEIAPLNGGDLFLQLLEDQRRNGSR